MNMSELAIALYPQPTTRALVLARLGRLSEARCESIPKVIQCALAELGIDKHRWTGVWFDTLDDDLLLEALDKLDPPH